MKQIIQEILPANDFQICELEGFSSLDSNTSLRLRNHRILILVNGASRVTIDEVTIAIHPGQILLMAKGQVVRFAEDAVVNGYEISFTDSFWEKAPQSASNCKSVLFDQRSSNQALPLNPEELADLRSLSEVMLGEFKKPGFTNKADVLAAYLKILMIKIANINYGLEERYGSYDKKIFLAFQELVSLNYMQCREVAYFASQLHVSAKQLYEICYKQAAVSPKKLISGKVLEEAKRLLQFTALPVKEIAFTLNFTSAEQFSHFFKKQSSVSPQKYRATQVNFDI